MPIIATIKEVNDNPDDPKAVDIVVEYSDGKTAETKTHKYSSTNLQNKQQVLDMIQGELGVLAGFRRVVDELKSEIDAPIEYKAKLEVTEDTINVETKG